MVIRCPFLPFPGLPKVTFVWMNFHRDKSRELCMHLWMSRFGKGDILLEMQV